VVGNFSQTIWQLHPEKGLAHCQVLAKGLHTNHSLEVLELHGNNFTSLAGQVPPHPC